MTVQLLDLKSHHDMGLLKQVYEDLYCQAFIEPSEQESLQQYQDRLFLETPPPPQPVTHFVVAGEQLTDPTRRQLHGFVIFESYRRSGVGLLTYLVTNPAMRGRGLGRLLMQHACGVLAADMDHSHGTTGGLAAVLAEVHDPQRVDAAHDTMDPAVRIRVMRSLGAHELPVAYVQPPLQPGASGSRNLLLVAFPCDGVTMPVSVPAMALSRFLREFYEALGVPDPDHDPDLNAMLSQLRAVQQEPAHSMTTGQLPCANIVPSHE